MTGDWRRSLAVGAGRLTGTAVRALHRGGGTTLPGDIARALDPMILRKLAAQARRGTVLITGTNGKTTTAALVRAAAAAHGWRVVGNPSGANLIYGLTAAAVQAAQLDGLVEVDWFVFEVDELTLPRAVAELQPRVLTLLNLYRDQLDRSFELEQIAQRLATGVGDLPAGARCLANADDPLVALAASAAAQPAHFSITDPRVGRDHLPPGADTRACPRCGDALVYDRVIYAHCGRYHCPACGLAPPGAEFRATEVDAAGLSSLGLTVEEAEGPVTLRSRFGGLYNAPNLLAAYATARLMGVPAQTAASALAATDAPFGRQEVVEIGGRRIRLLLAKNPAGFDEALRAATDGGPTPALALGLNDRIADGRDVSWIWDVDFEHLSRRPQDGPIVVTGSRAADLMLRLKYAGVPASRLERVDPPAAALHRLAALTPAGVISPALLTYTAVLDWHRALTREGLVSPYWRVA